MKGPDGEKDFLRKKMKEIKLPMIYNTSGRLKGVGGGAKEVVL